MDKLITKLQNQAADLGPDNTSQASVAGVADRDLLPGLDFLFREKDRDLVAIISPIISIGDAGVVHP